MNTEATEMTNNENIECTITVSHSYHLLRFVPNNVLHSSSLLIKPVLLTDGKTPVNLYDSQGGGYNQKIVIMYHDMSLAYTYQLGYI